MKIKAIGRLVTLGSLLALPLSTAFAQLTLTPQIRPRAEWRNGYKNLPSATAKAAFFVSQRSRVTLDYKQDKITSRFSFQDVRVWGDEEQAKDVASVSVHEAWGEIMFSDVFSMRLGRQELAYNDERLLGSVDWAQQARSHDAVVLKARFNNDWSLDAGGAFNQEKEQLSQTDYTLNNYKVLGFVWGKKVLQENFTLSGLFVSDGFQGKGTNKDILFRYTYGADLMYKKGELQLNGAFYHQSGTGVSDKAIGAYMGVAEAHYTLNSLKATIGFNHLSGSGGERSKTRTFNTLYATNHKYYGYMDYFTNLPMDTRNGGLHDNYFKLHYSTNPNYNVALDYHYFALAANVPATETLSGTKNKYLGSELDAVFNYKYSEGINFSVGYSTLFASDSMEALRGGDASQHTDWGWLMVNIQPKILLKAFDKEQ
ncbi:alginate export family protein [Pontibacter vulgaris]|uniref:alginate export family protein n=1 Tax=Pontibacter vulgaris TaxID=2905679 RepID=UPI001FA8144D|nr:alginate export family protein [Pontibacter vulgaris]